VVITRFSDQLLNQCTNDQVPSHPGDSLLGPKDVSEPSEAWRVSAGVSTWDDWAISHCALCESGRAYSQTLGLQCSDVSTALDWTDP